MVNPVNLDRVNLNLDTDTQTPSYGEPNHGELAEPI